MNDLYVKISETLEATMLNESNNAVRFKINVTGDDLRQGIKQGWDNLQNNPKIASKFKMRPGRVPMSYLETEFKQMHTESSMAEYIAKRLASHFNVSVLTSFKVEPGRIMYIEYGAFDFSEENSTIHYELAVELAPEVPALELEKISINTYKVEITKSDIDNAMRNWARSNTRSVECDPRPIKEGDTITVDLTAQVGGETDDRKGMSLKVGAGVYGEIEPKLIGRSVGDRISHISRIPANVSGNPALDGKQMIVNMTVRKVMDSVQYDVDDVMARAMGYTNLDEVAESVARSLAAEVDQMNFVVAVKQIKDFITAEYKVEFPQRAFELECKGIWHEIFNMSWNVNEEDFERTHNMRKDAALGKVKQIVQSRLLCRFVLENVRSANNITLGTLEEEAAFREHMRRFPFSEEDMIKAMQSLDATGKLREQIRRAAIDGKVLRFIIKHASSKELKSSFEELRAIVNEIATESPFAEKPENIANAAVANKGAELKDVSNVHTDSVNAGDLQPVKTSKKSKENKPE